MQQILFFTRIFSHLHALIEPPRLLISEKPATNTVFYDINILKNPTYYRVPNITGVPQIKVYEGIFSWKLIE